MVAEHSRVVEGVLLVSKGIEVAAHTLQAVDDVERPAALGTLKRHMLAEMSQSLVARSLMARSGSYAKSAVDHGRGRGAVYDAQAVGECAYIIIHKLMQNYHFLLC